MKNSIFLLSFLVLFFSCKEKKTTLDKNKKSFTVTVNISKLNDSISAFIYKDKFHSRERIDSIVFKNGSFKVMIPSNSKTEEYNIVIQKYPTNKFIANIQIWAKDEDTSISGVYDDKRIVITDRVIKGSHLNTIQKEYDDILIKYEKILKEEFEKAKTPEASQALFKKAMKLIYAGQIKFIFENPNNLVSLSSIFIHKSRISKDSLSLYYNRLDTILQNTERGKVLKELSSVKQHNIGDQIDNFKAKDINGKIVQLYDFKGKIILLDFWASWCVPCRTQIKEELSDLYKRYKDKLVIISYSLDEKSAKQDWKNVSEEEHIQWVNLSNLKGFNDVIARKYNVNAVPNTFLINREGLIVKSFVGYKKGNVEKELKKLLKSEK